MAGRVFDHAELDGIPPRGIEPSKYAWTRENTFTWSVEGSYRRASASVDIPVRCQRGHEPAFSSDIGAGGVGSALSRVTVV
jgi:hypothetical protein